MLSFKEFLIMESEFKTKHSNGTYMMAKVSPKSQNDIENWVKNTLKLETYIDPSEYHITICYSRTPVIEAEGYVGDCDMSAQPFGLTVFETKIMDKKYCLVLKVESKEATLLHEKLKSMGATFDYDEYTPHITLLYTDDKSTLVFDASESPNFAISLDEICVDGLKTEINIKTKEA